MWKCNLPKVIWFPSRLYFDHKLSDVIRFDIVSNIYLNYYCQAQQTFMILGNRNQKQTGLDQLSNPRAYDQVERRQKQKELLDLLNQKNQQIAILHQVNTRLGAQLSILQKKLGIDHENIIRQLENMKDISISFHYQIEQLQYLDHLFKAYDENNLKQKKLIALLYSQLEDSQKKSQNLVKDNQYLLNQMQNKCKQILQIYQKGYPDDNIIISYNKLQRQDEVQLMDTMREQNDYLLRYSKELEQKHMKMQIDFQQAKSQSQKYFQTYKQQTDELKDSYIKIDDLIKVKQVLQKKFDQISQQNIELESARQLLESKVQKLQQQVKNTKNQYYSQRTSSKQDIDKVQAELDSLRLQYDNTSKRQRQYFNKLMIMERQIQSLKDSNKNYKRQLQKTKADFQNTIRMLETYETKITNNNKKMESMNKYMQDYKQKLDSALLDKDKAQLKVDQLQKECQNLRSKHFDQSSNLKVSFQKIINNLNEKIRVLQESRQDLSSEINQREVTLKNQNQRVKRMNNQLRQQNSRFISNLKSNSGSQIVTKIKELEQRNDNLTKLINQKERAIIQEKEHCSDTVRNLQQQNRDLSRQAQKQRNNSSSYLKELTQLKSKLSIVLNDKECLENQIMKLKKSQDQNYNSNNDQKSWRITQLQQKLQQAIMKQKNTRQQAIKMLSKYDQAQNKLKNQYEDRINQLQTQNQVLKKKLKSSKEH